MADQPSTTAAAVQKRPLLYVYTLDVDPTLYSFSPFAVKLRLRLRHGGVPYEDRMGGLSGMPKGKIPYVQFLPQTDGDGKGEFMGDSGLVTDRLVKEGKLPDCNGELSAVDRVRDLCLRKLLEDNLYWLVMYERWYLCYDLMRDYGPVGHLPWGKRHVAAYFMSKYAGVLLWGQGTGRHKPGEVVQMIEEMVDSLNVLAEASLEKCKAGDGSKEPFWILGGEGPSEADFSLFGNLATLMATKINPLFRDRIKEKLGLVEYFKRIQDRYFPEVPYPL